VHDDTGQRHLVARACAKAIVTGEHFVVWGGTALAIPIHQARVTVRISASPASRNRISLAEDNAVVGTRSALIAARKAASAVLREQRYSARVSSNSTFPASAGLGGSAAFSVALCKALLRLAGQRGDPGLIAQLALDMERVFHGHPSGIDSTTIAYARPCFVKTGSGFAAAPTRKTGGPFAGFLDIPPGASFVLAWSGEYGDTRSAIQKVMAMAGEPKGALVLQRLTAVADTISLQAASAFRKGDFEFAGAMMNENQLLLRAIEVSTTKLDALAESALGAGALGAKMTGGGLGGFIIALCWPDDEERITHHLRMAGAPLVFTQPTSRFNP